MKRSYVLPALISLACYSASAQGPSKKSKKFSVSEFFLQAGSIAEPNKSPTLTEFRLLAPQSPLLNSNLSSFYESGAFGYSSKTFFSAALGFQFRNTDKTSSSKKTFRIGVTYLSGSNLFKSYNRTDRITYDTLRSSQSGQVLYADSVTNTGYYMNYFSEQLRIDLALIYRTNPQKRWSWFAGFGITGGSSLNAHTEISYNKSSRSEIRQPNGTINFSFNSFSSHSSTYQSEQYTNRNNIHFSAYIPLGIDFRISRTGEFLKRTHLFYEMRPGISVTSIPELRTFTTGSLQSGLGLRVVLN